MTRDEALRRLKLPDSIESLCEYIEMHAATTYLRVQIDGEWKSRALAQLPTDRAIHYALRFVREGRIPVHVLTAEESERRDRLIAEGALSE